MRGKDAFMSKKLDPEETTSLLVGGLKHSEIIGKRSRDTVRSTKGHDVRAYLPTLAEYIKMTPRKVTPVGLPLRFMIHGVSSHAPVGISRGCQSYCFSTRYPCGRIPFQLGYTAPGDSGGWHGACISYTPLGQSCTWRESVSKRQ